MGSLSTRLEVPLSAIGTASQRPLEGLLDVELIIDSLVLRYYDNRFRSTIYLDSGGFCNWYTSPCLLECPLCCLRDFVRACIVDILTTSRRRSLWAFFRVELEALQNWEEYRTIDFVPRLKPVFSSGKADKEAPTHDKRAFMVQKVSSYDIPLESTLNSDSLGEDLGRIDSGEMSSDWDRFRLEEKPFATKFSFRDSPASKRSPLPESHRGESTPQFSDDETATHRTKSPVSQPRDISFTQPKGLTELQVGSVRNTDMDRNKSRGKKSKKRNSK